jgi:hypothetical protein
MQMFRFISTAILFISLILPLKAIAFADTIHIIASRDNTLIEDPNSALSNGSGPFFFAGRTNQQANAIRRGLVHFDVASALPAGAKIRSVRLILFLAKANNVAGDIGVHRVLADWGEGASYATGGKGAAAEPGDATWLHTFYPDFFWSTAGGDFSAKPSAVQTIGGAVRSYTWGSTKQLVNDVESWVANPAENFGWVLIGDENTPQSVQAFSSREPLCDPVVTELPAPLLEVTYSLPGSGK